jgi:hypothetical protein
MIAVDELERLMDASVRDAAAEPAFFRALLDATMYAHTPIDPKADRLRFVMFKSPDDGTLVIPVFTDEAKARLAANGKVCLVEVPGRMLFELTRGATVMINPNDARCTLYPEEIRRLLDDGTVAPVTKSQVQMGDDTRLYKLPSVPNAFGRELKRVLRRTRGVEIAYITGTRTSQTQYPDGFLIALGGNGKEKDRTARAIATALYDEMCKLDRPVDIVQYVVGETPPPWIEDLGLKPIYRRRPSDAEKVTSPLN